MRSLEQILAEARADAAVLRRTGHEHDAALIERFVKDVEVSAEEWLRWLSENDARLRSGLSSRTLRRRFSEWARSGNARYNVKKEREYRMAVVPRRANVENARVAGRRGRSPRALASVDGGAHIRAENPRSR